MPHAAGVPRALWWYRVVYVACIVIMSVETMAHARNVTDHHFWLGGLEVIGALALLLRRTQLAGLVILLAVYAVVASHTVLTGGIPSAVVLFAASALVVVYVDREGVREGVR
jgi:hypothetical protein